MEDGDSTSIHGHKFDWLIIIEMNLWPSSNIKQRPPFAETNRNWESDYHVITDIQYCCIDKNIQNPSLIKLISYTYSIIPSLYLCAVINVNRFLFLFLSLAFALALTLSLFLSFTIFHFSTHLFESHNTIQFHTNTDYRRSFQREIRSQIRNPIKIKKKIRNKLTRSIKPRRTPISKWLIANDWWQFSVYWTTLQ